MLTSNRADSARKHSKTEIILKEYTKMIFLMEKDFIDGKMEAYSRAIFTKACEKDGDS